MTTRPVPPQKSFSLAFLVACYIVAACVSPPGAAAITLDDYQRFLMDFGGFGGIGSSPAFEIEAPPDGDLRETIGISNVRDLPPLLLPGTTPTPKPPTSPLPPGAYLNQTVYLVCFGFEFACALRH